MAHYIPDAQGQAQCSRCHKVVETRFKWKGGVYCRDCRDWIKRRYESGKEKKR